MMCISSREPLLTKQWNIIKKYVSITTNHIYLVNKTIIVILVFFDEGRTARIHEAVGAPLRSCPPSSTDVGSHNGVELVTAPQPELDGVADL